MENKFNFNSQVCTSREQSEKLLALGLKKETADMMYEGMAEGELPRIMPHKTEMDHFKLWDSIIPAWSLHRLIEMVARTQYPYYVISKELPIYDALCERIEWLIKEGYFNKKYLEE